MRGITPFFKPSAEITLDSGRKTTVRKIESFAFDGRNDIKSVEIHEGVKIGDGAFLDCTSLKSVEIHEGVKIGDGAFQGCTGLKSMVIHQGVEIGQDAFYRCTGLTSVVAHEGVTIRGGAFSCCTGLKSIVLHRETTLSQKPFFYCTGLTSVFIHEGVTIEQGAFRSCKVLTSVFIHQGAIIGGRGKLAGLKALTSIITRHDGVTTGKYALGDCTNLRSVYVMCGQEGDQVGWSTRNEEFAARHTKAGGTITFIQERVIKEIVNKIARDLSVNFLALFTAPENLEMFAGRQLGEAIGTGDNNHFAAQQQLTAEQLKITRRRFMRLFSLDIRSPLGTARKETIPVDICNAILTYVAYQNQGIDNSPNEVFTHWLIGDDDL